MKLSRRQIREVCAGEFLRVTIHQESNGEFVATLSELAHPTDIERYVSASRPTMGEALGLAAYEWDALVERRVDELEAEDAATEAVEAKSEWQRSHA